MPPQFERAERKAAAERSRSASDIRGKSGKVLNRAEIIRALIDGLLDSGMDVSGTASEADLRARVARRLGSPYR